MLIFLLGEVVLVRNGLFSGGERGVRLALFIYWFDLKSGTPFFKQGTCHKCWCAPEGNKQNFLFFSPWGIVRGAQSWVGATGCKEVPLDLGDSVVTHLERLAPPSLLCGGV